GRRQKGMRQAMADAEIIDLYEQMLYQRAIKGIRPVLYVSSFKDLECSLLMLLDESPEDHLAGKQRQIENAIGYHVMMN
ncbi:MAG TPA: hypothetical protein VNO14_08880, partial [Blastocatellia bacterium]|nr:hypothetical protein [Blastocatellia bacterium]